MTRLEKLDMERKTRAYVASLDVVTSRRVTQAIQKATGSKKADLYDLVDGLDLKRWRIVMQLDQIIVSGISDVNLAFIIERPRKPEKLRYRHMRMCRKYDIDIAIKGQGFNRREYMRKRYAVKKGREKVRGRVVDLADRIQVLIEKDAFPRECKGIIQSFVVELREISDLNKKINK